MKNAVPIIMLAVILLVPTGFAITYSGDAVVSVGSAEASCILIEPCVMDGSDYVYSEIITEKVGITKNENNGRYSLSASSTPLTPSGLFLHIYGAGTEEDVTVVCNVSVTGVGSCVAMMDDSTLTEREHVSQGYHSFSLLYSGTYNATSMPSVIISMEITAMSMSEGTVIRDSSAVRLKATSSSTVLEILNESNPEIVASDDYSFSSTTSTNHGNNYPSVGVHNDHNNQGGISDNEGQIDVEIIIPSGPSFVLYLRTSGTNTFHLTMTKGTEILVSGTVTFNAGGIFSTSGYYLSSVSADGSSSGYFYSSLNNVTSHNAWMSGDSDDIHLSITTEDGQSASRNLKMDIVFKKES